MTRSHKDGKKEGGERREEGDAVRMPSEQSLSNLNHPVHTARCLENSGTGHGGDDDINDIGRWVTGLQMESEDENGQTDTRDCAEGQRAIAGAYP